MSKFGLILSLVLIGSATQAHAIMAIKKPSIVPQKSEYIFTDKASLSVTGKGLRSKLYQLKDADYFAVETKNGVLLTRVNDKGVKTVNVDASIKTIEQLEAQVLRPNKAAGLGLASTFANLQGTSKARVIQVDGKDEEIEEEIDEELEEEEEEVVEKKRRRRDYEVIEEVIVEEYYVRRRPQVYVDDFYYGPRVGVVPRYYPPVVPYYGGGGGPAPCFRNPHTGYGC